MGVEGKENLQGSLCHGAESYVNCLSAANSDCSASSRKISIETVGWGVDDDDVHYISNVQADNMLSGDGRVQRSGAILQQHCHRAAAIHFLLSISLEE